MADFRSPNFRVKNFIMLLDRWLYNIVLMYAFWIYLAWLILAQHSDAWKIFALNYMGYVSLGILQLLMISYYSMNRRRDLIIGLATPLMPLYQIFISFASLIAVTEEIFTRRSFKDGFVPAHVRKTTWHW